MNSKLCRPAVSNTGNLVYTSSLPLRLSLPFSRPPSLSLFSLSLSLLPSSFSHKALSHFSIILCVCVCVCQRGLWENSVSKKPKTLKSLFVPNQEVPARAESWNAFDACTVFPHTPMSCWRDWSVELQTNYTWWSLLTGTSLTSILYLSIRMDIINISPDPYQWVPHE